VSRARPYARPAHVDCYLCGRPIAVARRGRIPETHAGCARWRDDCNRLPGSLAAAVAEAQGDLAAVRRLRVVWRDLESEITTAWTTLDNPRSR